MRLIDADALNDAMFRKSFETDDGRQKWDSGLWIRYKVFEEARDETPTIDAVPATIDGALGYLHKVGWIQEHDRIMTEDAAPVRHGWWDTSEDNRIVCSECTHGAPYMYKISDKLIMQELTYYCPYCGARMDGESDE